MDSDTSNINLIVDQLFRQGLDYVKAIGSPDNGFRKFKNAANIIDCNKLNAKLDNLDAQFSEKAKSMSQESKQELLNNLQQKATSHAESCMTEVRKKEFAYKKDLDSYPWRSPESRRYYEETAPIRPATYINELTRFIQSSRLASAASDIGMKEISANKISTLIAPSIYAGIKAIYGVTFQSIDFYKVSHPEIFEQQDFGDEISPRTFCQNNPEANAKMDRINIMF
ncbi:hypothetical protein H4219_005159 [Mycoemilia scoparia]|uniref:Uncharacterized protein n=1 Tax=Mycoemilia scoparia TaxID=417184 RepID=A0A9W7ZU23_9FUNG|nr:hypothetical protein H4219_005159 [Mycoemilia scoparia]